MNKDKIGIVTVLYKSESVVNDFFESLNIQKYKNFVLYVVNNNSPDRSIELCKSLSKNVFFKTVFIDNKENYGVAKGNNQGILCALNDQCKYILLSNNDVFLNENTLSELYDDICVEKVDMAVPKIYYYNTNKIWSAGGTLNLINARAKHFGSLYEDNGQFNKNKKISYAPTCFMIIKSDVFYDVGLMDERYFVYYDDVDFVYRCQKQQKILYYFSNACLYHKESISTGKGSDFSLYYNYRNRLLFVSKYYLFKKMFAINDLFYHFTVRKCKMRHSIHEWNVCWKGIKDGMKYIFLTTNK